MGAGEREVIQVVTMKPSAAPTRIRSVTGCEAVENVKSDAIAGDGVFDGAKLFEGMRRESERGLGDLVRVGFAIEFGVWEFPEVRINDASGSLLNEVTGIPFDDESVESPRGSGSAAEDVG